MGFSPDIIDKMTLWKFYACQDGWLIQNDPKAKRLGARSTIDLDRLCELGIEGF